MHLMNKILHVAEDISITSGGLRTMILELNNYLNQNKIDSNILTLKKEAEDVSFESCVCKGNPWWYANDLKDKLNIKLSENNFMHLHGAWMYPQYIAAKLSRKQNVPYLMTFHGMLEPFLLKDKYYKKAGYFEIILKKAAKKAQILHAITPNEKNNLFNDFNHNQIIEIPNLIHFKEEKQAIYNPEEDYFLFLGRFHRVKGIDLLLNAFEKMSNKQMKLYLVGFENDYSKKIMKRIEHSTISHRVKFCGALVNHEKELVIANAKALISPSFSEVIGMVNLEAANMRTPVITTFNTGINKDWGNNGGIIINPNIEEITSALNKASDWSNNERIERGNHLYEYVYYNYSWQKKGKLWIELYNHLMT